MFIVLYDCKRTEDYYKQIPQTKEQLLLTLRALSDENRTKILKLIAREEFNLNGKKIAEKLKLSPSVVLRHPGQIKDAGLIIEKSPDNRNITCSLQEERLAQISDSLLRYIDD